MNLTPIQSNAPTPREPDDAKVVKNTETRSEPTTKQPDAVKARGLVAEIGSRLASLRQDAESRRARVGEALEEVRNGTLLASGNLEQAAEGILMGDDPEAMPPEA